MSVVDCIKCIHFKVCQSCGVLTGRLTSCNDFQEEMASCEGGMEICEIFHQKPMTNADRIRAMTDEELATELLPLFEELCEDCIPSVEYMRFWLKQPCGGADQ